MNSVIAGNFSWMIYNILLAIIPVLLARLFYKAKSPLLKVIFFAWWLFFVPNTIYLFTDILHLMDQISEVDYFSAVVLTVQYTALFISGFLTYVLSMYPIEKKLRLSPSVIAGLNFLIGFGIVIGRIHRLNSWDVIFQPEKVFNAALETATALDMFALAILFGLFANFMYFLFRKKAVKYVSKTVKKI